MNNSVEINPYSPTAVSEEPSRPITSLIFRVLLIFAALNLSWHGGLMIFSYVLQLSHAQAGAGYFDSNFYPAMFFKDGVTGITALGAAMFIFRKHPLGWWMAMIHWQWYLTWNAILVVVAERFAWQFPVRYEQTAIIPNIAKCLIFSLVAIAFFNLKPILRILNATIDRRLTKIALIFIATVSLGFLINWWWMQ